MTIASANVNIKLAFPQGLTQTEIDERLHEILEHAFEQHECIVEYEVDPKMEVNADPFNENPGQRFPCSLAELHGMTNGYPRPLAIR